MTQPDPNDAEQWRQFQEWKAWQAQQRPPKKPTQVPWWAAILVVLAALLIAWGVAVYYANDNIERRPTIRIVPNR